MKGLGLFFQNFFEFLIFINFSMFYTYLNMTQILIFGNTEKYQKLAIFKQKDGFFERKFFEHFFLKFFYPPVPEKRPDSFLN